MTIQSLLQYYIGFDLICEPVSKFLPKYQRRDHFALTYFVRFVVRTDRSVLVFGVNGRINAGNQRDFAGRAI